MVDTQALLFIYAVLGIILNKTGLFAPRYRESYVRFLINVTLPCMILASFLSADARNALRDSGVMIMISTGILLAALFISKIIWKKIDRRRQSVLTFGTLFSNAGNAGLPVVSLVYGDVGVMFASMYLLPVRILMWTVGVGLYMDEADGKKTAIALLKNPSVMVVFLGVFMMLLGIELPGVAMQAVKSIGNITLPLSMMIVGAVLSETSLKSICNRASFLLSFMRLIVIPGALLLILWALNVPSLLSAVAVTLTAMPAASNTAILAERYGADAGFASGCVFLSTVLSLATVPAITYLLACIWQI